MCCDCTLKMARVIKDWQKIYNDAWDYEWSKWLKVNNYDLIYYGDCQTKSKDEAFEDACKIHNIDENLKYILYLGLDWWNDLADWSEDILESAKNPD